jgi:two-component system, OmpR family, response regulator
MLSRPPGANPKILVADDDDLLSEVVSQSLRSNGYRVSCAPRGVIAPELTADVDLVVLDANIPEVDFDSTFRFLEESHIAVLVLTGETSPPAGVRPDQYLGKPVDLEDLLAAVKRLALARPVD